MAWWPKGVERVMSVLRGDSGALGRNGADVALDGVAGVSLLSYSQLKNALSALTRLLTVWLDAFPHSPFRSCRCRMKSLASYSPTSSRRMDMPSLSS